MDIKTSLFTGEQICLAPIDLDKDAEIEAIWTQNAEYMRQLNLEPARPLSPEQVKKRYTEIEKEADEKKNLFYFTIRLRSDDQLIGFARIYWIGWTSGFGLVQLGIGDSTQRGKGYGTQALSLLLRYAFAELNLHSLAADIPEYNLAATRLFQNAGFVEETRQRQAVYREGRRWDLIFFGILKDEWSKRNGRHLSRRTGPSWQ